ncbi:hypothetical protein BP6252_10550 [Coleophoma cylindrospora]|uniref:MJ1316 RNA cyclic group end recognition domain-containing protein n=1 Tax=Coleophoma cylindrospora TaxID=1849047 RepID=A0A3D8QSV7_9HELO|nr:hypothetical protein BP6252_10550 [Coleophoma cylindrospora]
MASSLTSFNQLRQLLFPDHSLPSLPGRPTFQLHGVDAFIANLSQVDPEHKCLVTGTARRELFLEILWQRILDAPADVEIIPHVMEDWEMVFSFAGCVWKLEYARIEQKATMERLRLWEMVRTGCQEAAFQCCYEFLVEGNWLMKRGIYDHGDQGVSEGLNIEQVMSLILAFAKDSTPELKTSSDLVSAFFAYYGSESRKHPNLPRTAQLEFAKAHAQIQQGGFSAFNLKTGESPVEVMDAPFYVKLSFQWTGYSELQGGLAVRELYRDLYDLVHAQQLRSTQSHLRLWPNALVAAEADVNDTPYEALYLVGIQPTTPSDIKTATAAATSLLAELSHLAPTKDVLTHAELTPAPTAREQTLQPSMKTWPPRRANPPPELQHAPEAIKPRARPQPQRPSASAAAAAPRAHADGQPGRKMRPALDVLNRLRYDPGYKLDDFVIGYLDRHAGVVEKPAGAWEVDSTCEEWVPQHKILYFRDEKGGKEGGKVWEREARLDRVFGERERS